MSYYVKTIPPVPSGSPSTLDALLNRYAVYQRDQSPLSFPFLGSVLGRTVKSFLSLRSHQDCLIHSPSYPLYTPVSLRCGTYWYTCNHSRKLNKVLFYKTSWNSSLYYNRLIIKISYRDLGLRLLSNTPCLCLRPSDHFCAKYWIQSNLMSSTSFSSLFTNVNPT